MKLTGEYLLGIDVGTTMIKGALFALDGTEVFVEARTNKTVSPKPGWAEQDMDAIWESTKAIIGNIVEKNRLRPEQILVIGITGQGQGTWLIDKNGDPVARAILWMDARSNDIVAKLNAKDAATELFKFTGTVITASDQPIQLKWLKKNRPGLLKKAQYSFYCKDWLFYKLTGVVATDETDVSHEYFNLAQRQYAEEVFALYGIADLFGLMPKARPSFENVEVILAKAAGELGLSPKTPVVAGPFDVCACALGVGTIHDGEVSTVLGTAGINQMVMDEALTEPAGVGLTMCYGPAGKWLRVFPTMTSTVSLDWFIQQFCESDLQAAKQAGKSIYTYLEKEKLTQTEVGAGGLIYHPFIDLAGERAPFVKPTARAQFLGINSEQTRYDFLRAVYEGITFANADCYNYMPKPIGEISLTGGGARSDFWNQMHADITGKEIRLVEGTESGAKGAVINAATAVGIFPDFVSAIDQLVHSKTRFIPNTAHYDLYQDVFKLYREGYKATWDFWDLRGEIIKGY